MWGLLGEPRVFESVPRHSLCLFVINREVRRTVVVVLGVGGLKRGRRGGR